MAKKLTYYAYLRQQMGSLIEQLDLPEFCKQSLKERWLDQVIWADKKADHCRRWHYRLRLTTIVGGVILPALVGVSLQLGTSSPFFRVWFPPLAFGLSQIIAVSAALEEFCRFGDRWRDYRKMSEDLKAEGWQYLQSSGAYEASGSHVQSYAQFASQVESIIKQDVQGYISDLMKRQAKQDAQVEQILGHAASVATNRNLIGQLDANPTPIGSPYARSAGMPPSPYSAAPGYPPPGYPPPGYPPPGYPPSAALGSGTPGAAPGYAMPPPAPPQSGFVRSSSGIPEPMSIAPLPNGSSAVPVPPLVPEMTPPSPPSFSNAPSEPSPPIGPSASLSLTQPQTPVELNAAILAAAQKLKGMSTTAGPDGGNNACAWTVNQVLQEAGIAPLGDNPNYVPALLDALKSGRGQMMARQTAKAGDLVIASGEMHIGIGMDEGCQTVLSNSSSRGCFVWESDTDFDGYYGGSSLIYRLLH